MAIAKTPSLKASRRFVSTLTSLIRRLRFDSWPMVELAVLPTQVVDTTVATVAVVTLMRLPRTLIGDFLGLPGQGCG